MIVYLIGFMGSGKSTVGARLARKLSFNFYDLDEQIEQHESCSISTIFENKGEAYFRLLEHETLIQLSQNNNCIISCGGGTPCFYNNMEIMNNSGFTVYLKLSSEALYSRLKQAKTTRPLLKDKSEIALKDYIKEKLAERESYYLKSKLITSGININVDLLQEHIKTFNQ